MTVVADSEAMSLTSPRRHNGVTKLLHWLTVALLIGAYALAWSIDGAGSRDTAAWLIMLHRSFGLAILTCTLLRLVWRRTSAVPALPSEIPRLQRMAAHATVIALYALLLLQPTLGLIASQAHGDRVVFLGRFVLPTMIEPNRALSRQLFNLHGDVAITLLAVIALHVLAALYHHVIRRDDILRGMLPSFRRRSRQSELSEV